MAVEIERKFLVNRSIWQQEQPTSQSVIQQGYLSLAPERTVRIRIKDKLAYLTIKGKNKGIVRTEFEYKIPLEEGLSMLPLCEGAIITKTRYTLNVGRHEWEVDDFSGDNKGLLIAEIELQSPSEKITLPPWIKEEVSQDARYYNANLVRHPFKDW